MTGRTHDLAAFTGLSYIVATQPLQEITFATALTALTANFIGGLVPDIDQSTADLYRRLPAGSIFGKIISPLFGGHRFISHSIVGIVLFGVGLSWILNAMSNVLLVNMQIVWWAFMIGFVSHLVMDTFTKEGVPWFFPIPWKIGIPPLKLLRIKTGGLMEKIVVFPGLILINIWIYYFYYQKFLLLLRFFVSR